MSAQSGIKVPSTIPSAFSSAQSEGDAVRALVFVIDGESFKLHDTIEPQSTFKDDISLLPKSLPSHKTPASFAYRLDSKQGGRFEWMMVTFVPDDAGVRAKMLQASSRAALMKALGSDNFKHDWFATNVNDLSPGSLTSHLNHLSSPAPLSASEKALIEVREAEALEAKRTALDPENEARRRKAVVGLAGKMQFQDGVREALEKVAKRSDEGWITVLEIPAGNTAAISLVTSEACTPSQLSSKLPAKSPSFTFYSFPTPPPAVSPSTPAKSWKASAGTPGNSFQASEGGKRVVTSNWKPAGDGDGEVEGEAEKGDEKKGEVDEPDVKQLSIDGEEDKETKVDDDNDAVSASPVEEKPTSIPTPSPTTSTKEIKGRVIFIYSCPSSSPVKFRMIYSTNVRGVQQDASDNGVEVVGKLETSDISDLTESNLRSALPPTKPTHSSSLPNPSSSTSNSGASYGNTNTNTNTTGAPKPAFGAPAPAFGGAFGRPRPIVKKEASLSSISASASAGQIPLPASVGPSTPITPTGGNGDGGDDDSKDRIKSAFDAFGPRVGGGGGGFARPKPAGRR